MQTIDCFTARFEQIGHMIEIFRMTGEEKSIRCKIALTMLKQPLLGWPIKIDHDVAAENGIILNG